MLVILVFDDGFNMRLKIAWQEAVLQGLVQSVYLTLGLWNPRCTANMIQVL
ncbi:hypothetical protein [Pararhizobium sp. IMCC21322]|uniref:hypothetical protein n=1 Tax=Pararhizobium sp. IMCC21322 TaxID=3067903 RepID=UPI003531D4BD